MQHPGASSSSDPQQSQNRMSPVRPTTAFSWSWGSLLALQKPIAFETSPPVHSWGWYLHALEWFSAGSKVCLHRLHVLRDRLCSLTAPDMAAERCPSLGVRNSRGRVPVKAALWSIYIYLLCMWIVNITPSLGDPARYIASQSGP